MKLLLHVCCGPCATWAIKSLMEEYSVTCYFYNPCIEPFDEYEKRKDAFVKVCEELGVDYVIGDYDNDSFRELVKGLEDEPENGKRCLKCYEQRLKKAASYGEDNGFDMFTTTLTISPHKRSDVIFRIGNEVIKNKKIKFLEKDFKKKDGFNQSVSMSKEMGLYRQGYCGCEFSKSSCPKSRSQP